MPIANAPAAIDGAGSINITSEANPTIMRPRAVSKDSNIPFPPEAERPI
ncbi:MAG: hypothetical protein ACREDL_14940 [Bradyrhizobium sp.]